MRALKLEPGDTIYATKELRNDGSLPGLEDDAIVAHEGNRGVLINIGHLEEQESQTLYLVRFENSDLDLGPAVTCWPDEIRPHAVSDDA